MNATADKFDEIGARLMAKDVEIERLRAVLLRIAAYKGGHDGEYDDGDYCADLAIEALHLNQQCPNIDEVMAEMTEEDRSKVDTRAKELIRQQSPTMDKDWAGAARKAADRIPDAFLDAIKKREP